MDLLNRALLRLEGADALPFLQKLVTQDLHPDAAAYTLLLTPQGRYLFDFFVIPSGDKVYIDVAAHQADELVATLTKYKLRSAVSIHRVFPACIDILFNEPTSPTLLAFRDSRHDSLGWRVWRASERYSETEIPAHYKIFLTRHGIVEPAHELRPNVDMPLEYGLHNCNAVSFTKGCFLGQELTARTQHKGLIKNTILVAAAPYMVACDTPVHDADGHVVGRVHRCTPPHIMLQVKVEAAAQTRFFIGGAEFLLASC